MTTNENENVGGEENKDSSTEQKATEAVSETSSTENASQDGKVGEPSAEQSNEPDAEAQDAEVSSDDAAIAAAETSATASVKVTFDGAVSAEVEIASGKTLKDALLAKKIATTTNTFKNASTGAAIALADVIQSDITVTVARKVSQG